MIGDYSKSFAKEGRSEVLDRPYNGQHFLLDCGIVRFRS